MFAFLFLGFSCQMQAGDWRVQSVWRDLNSTPGVTCSLPLLHCWAMGTRRCPDMGVIWSGLCLVFKNKQNKIILNLILFTWSSYPEEGSRRQGEKRRGGEQIESHRGVFLKAVCKYTFFVITRANPTFEVFLSCYKENVFCLIHLALNTWPDQSCWLDYTVFMLILNWPGQGRGPGSASLVGESQE